MLVAHPKRAGARSCARVSEANLRVTMFYREELAPDRDVTRAMERNATGRQGDVSACDTARHPAVRAVIQPHDASIQPDDGIFSNSGNGGRMSESFGFSSGSAVLAEARSARLVPEECLQDFVRSACPRTDLRYRGSSRRERAAERAGVGTLAREYSAHDLRRSALKQLILRPARRNSAPMTDDSANDG